MVWPAPAHGSFGSYPHDPDAQRAAKDLARKKQWVGYKVQIAETVSEDGAAKAKVEPTEQFLTEVTTTEAIASDFDGRRRVEANQHANGQKVDNVVGLRIRKQEKSITDLNGRASAIHVRFSYNAQRAVAAAAVWLWANTTILYSVVAERCKRKHFRR